MRETPLAPNTQLISRREAGRHWWTKRVGGKIYRRSKPREKDCLTNQLMSRKHLSLDSLQMQSDPNLRTTDSVEKAKSESGFCH